MDEALALGDSGIWIAASVLAWLYAPRRDDPRISAAIRGGIELSVGSLDHLRCVSDIARELGQPVRVYLEFDSGLGHGGIQWSWWPALVRDAAHRQDAGNIRVVEL